MAEPWTNTLLPEHFSARLGFGRRARIVLMTLAVCAIAGTALFPLRGVELLTVLIAVVYLICTIDRNLLVIRGIRSSALVSVSDADALAVPDDDLPPYTVLLPVYDEPTIVQNLVDGVCKLNYPHDKIEILLLVEEDDPGTREALDTDLDARVRVVTVPHSLPKTKPKACNYGMSLPDVRGEFITIYDAEDLPEHLQLRRAVVAFRRSPADIGCLQARLGYFNESQNLLTRWFGMEYDQWFGAVLPAVQQLRCVVPLGGTSGHIPTSVWREVGGWDEHNVTEDADLGVRLARCGYRTLILNSITLEEANSDLINWIRQRSRWYKGYLQTMIVHLRSPLVLRREIGVVATLRFINMTGAIPLTNAANLVFGSALLGWIIGRPEVINAMFPTLTYYVCLSLFLVAAPLSLFVGMVGVVALGKPGQWWVALLTPGYWMLQSLAAVKAIYQLFARPFYWEKTVHGLAQPGGGS